MNPEDLSALRERIEGKRVLTASEGKLTLDDGTLLHLYCSDSDCCAHASGEWVINPDALDAIITDVKFEDIDAEEGDDWDGTTNRAKITILHNQNAVAFGDCYANDGNGGYYFSVLSLSVVVPGYEDQAVDVDVVSA